MKYKVTIGTVRHNEMTVKEGNFIELADKYAKPLLASGAIEVVLEAKAKVKEVKPKVVKVKVEKVEAKPVAKVEPSEDWTRKELDDHALLVGIKNPEKVISKKVLLKLISKIKK